MKIRILSIIVICLAVIVMILSVLSLLLLFPAPAHDYDRFKLVDSYHDCVIYTDLQSGVLYARVRGGMFPLFDSYGNPLIYQAFDAREDRLP